MAIQITEAALKKIKESYDSRGLDAAAIFLRIGVRGGGCSGFSYTLEFDEKQTPQDKIFEFPFPGAGESAPKLKALIDTKSCLYLVGVILDYTNEGLGGFVFNNPNAKSGCGCGHSFST